MTHDSPAPETLLSALRRVCAWCGAFVGGDPDSPKTTHGICDGCLERVLARSLKGGGWQPATLAEPYLPEAKEQ